MRGRPTAREPSTIRARTAEWVRFLASGPELSVRGARSYLAALLARGASAPYLLGVLSHLSVGLRRLRPLTAADEATLADTRSSLKRLLPFHRRRQAAPATVPVVAALEVLEPLARGLLVRLLWHSAARFSDWVGRLPVEAVTCLPRRWVTVQYRKTKTSTAGVVRLATFRLPRQAWTALAERMRCLRPRQSLFSLPYAAFYTWLRAHAPGLTPHSFRRGAVQAMLDGGVPPKEVCRLTGHRALSTLYGYADRLPPSARAAMTLAAPLLGA